MVIWDLDVLHKLEDTEKLIDEVKAGVEAFKKHRSKLNKDISPEVFMSMVKELERLSIVKSRLIGRAGLWLTENTSDPKRTAHEARISELIADADNGILFFNLWFKSLDDITAEKLIAESHEYHYVLERLIAFKPHTLEEKEEQIINLKDLTGVEAVTKIYDIITNKFKFEWEGKLISQEEINVYKQSHDRKERKECYEVVLGKYGKFQEELAEIYRALVNDWKNENLKLRNHKTPIGVRNLANDVPDEAVEALMNVIRKNVELFQEYFKLKAKLLGLEDMKRYDLYAPLKPREKEYPYGESKEIVLETYKQFSPQAHDMAVEIFDKDHVHSDMVENKRSGAFCWGVLKDLPPYIMLNHVNKLNDLFTMMHEFGHGIHAVAARKQTQFTFHSSLPMAETASIFGEMLLSQRLLKEADDEEKVAILLRNLDSQYASIIRQAYFVMFEIKAHEMIANGATVDELNEEYMNNLKEQFGDCMEIQDHFKYEWSYIPHIHHTPFYCYAYAWGNLLVLALYKMYEEQGQDFVPKYMDILAAGGSDSAQRILANIGIDITKEEFWQRGFDVIKEELELLKKLTE